MAKKTVEISVEEKLRALYDLQIIDSRLDEIRNTRGELPIEVEDLEIEIEGLNKRAQKFENEIKDLNDDINNKKEVINHSKSLMEKYKSQQDNVRNNKEFEALAKEIEFQDLEVQLAEKKIKEFTAKIAHKNELLDELKGKIGELESHLNFKKNELDALISETQKEEEELIAASEKLASVIEDRLLAAYKRIRSNARNGLAVANVERDACGGCFNKIPPQRQLDIKTHKKIIVCEYCGRILLDAELIKSELENA